MHQQLKSIKRKIEGLPPVTHTSPPPCHTGLESRTIYPQIDGLHGRSLTPLPWRMAADAPTYPPRNRRLTETNTKKCTKDYKLLKSSSGQNETPRDIPCVIQFVAASSYSSATVHEDFNTAINCWQAPSHDQTKILGLLYTPILTNLETQRYNEIQNYRSYNPECSKTMQQPKLFPFWAQVILRPWQTSDSTVVPFSPLVHKTYPGSSASRESKNFKVHSGSLSEQMKGIHRQLLTNVLKEVWLSGSNDPLATSSYEVIATRQHVTSPLLLCSEDLTLKQHNKLIDKKSNNRNDSFTELN